MARSESMSFSFRGENEWSFRKRSRSRPSGEEENINEEIIKREEVKDHKIQMIQKLIDVIK